MERGGDLIIDDLLHGLAEAEAKDTQQASVHALVCFEGVVAFVFGFGTREEQHSTRHIPV